MDGIAYTVLRFGVCIGGLICCGRMNIAGGIHLRCIYQLFLANFLCVGCI